MTAEDALHGLLRLGLDSAPIIYFVEGNPQCFGRCLPFFQAMDSGTVEGFTSTLVLPETLVHPLRNNDAVRANEFRNLLTSPHITAVPLTSVIAERAAQLRADFNLRTPDAIQIATAIHSRCDAFLTNDVQLKRVTELRVIVVSELDI